MRIETERHQRLKMMMKMIHMRIKGMQAFRKNQNKSKAIQNEEVTTLSHKEHKWFEERVPTHGKERTIPNNRRYNNGKNLYSTEVLCPYCS